jgi:hypothetical protein
MHRLRAQDGQATIDYVALVALLAVLVTVTASLTGFAPGIVNATLGQFRHALCLVRGGDCPAVALQPCVVASKRDAQHLSVSILLFRIDEDHVVLREKMSDGTVRLTVSEDDGAGVTAGVGANAQLKLKGRSIGFRREMNGSALGVLGHGSVYVARNDREADEILRALRTGVQLGPGIRIGGDHPQAQSKYVAGGLRGLGKLGLNSFAAGASLDTVSNGMLGASRNFETGEVTISLTSGRSDSGLLHVLLSGATRAKDREVQLALKLDRHGSPLQLTLESTGTFAAGSALPVYLARLDGHDEKRALNVTNSDLTGRRWELAAQVDLHDPDVAAAWRAFLHDPTSGDAIRALGTIMRERAQLDVRTYATRSDSSGGSLSVSALAKLAVEGSQDVDRAQLLNASTRPVDGLWEQRFDCGGQAA